MTQLMAFPFRLDQQGYVTMQDDASDEYIGAELAVIMMTGKQERELVPAFGVTDPVYWGLDEVEFITAVAQFGPPVIIKAIDQDYPVEGFLAVNVDYDTAESFSSTGGAGG